MSIFVKYYSYVYSSVFNLCTITLNLKLDKPIKINKTSDTFIKYMKYYELR